MFIFALGVAVGWASLIALVAFVFCWPELPG